jgi:XFP C-terminal domain
MVVLNDLDRFHLVGDVIDRVPHLGARAAYAKQSIRDKLLDHKTYIATCGEDMSEIRNWKWPLGEAAREHETSGQRSRQLRSMDQFSTVPQAQPVGMVITGSWTSPLLSTRLRSSIRVLNTRLEP